MQYQSSYINYGFMRLAAEYHQNKKETNKPDQNARNYIVRLGQGKPGQQGRKRGISLSNSKQPIDQHSLARGEVSRQKQVELSREKERQPKQQTNSRTRLVQTHNQSPTKIVSIATYGSRPVNPAKGYALQHLESPRNQPQVYYQQPQLCTVRSQQNFGRTNKQRFIAAPVQQPRVQQRFVRNPLPQRPISIHKANIVQVHTKLVSSPIIVTQPSFVTEPSIRSNSKIHAPLVRSNPLPVSQQGIFRLKSCEPQRMPATRVIMQPKQKVVVQPKQKVVIQKGGIFEVQTQKKREIVRKPKQQIESPSRINTKQKILDNNPYNLNSSKMTRKIDSSRLGDVEEELLQTRKQPRNQSIAVFSQTGSLSLQSKGKGLFSGGQISLWDANKAQSIVSISVRSSRDLKMQQSQVMMDYFNPSESQMQRL